MRERRVDAMARRNATSSGLTTMRPAVRGAAAEPTSRDQPGDTHRASRAADDKRQRFHRLAQH